MRKTLQRNRNYEAKKTTSFAKFGEGWDGDTYKVKKEKKGCRGNKAIQERKSNHNLLHGSDGNHFKNL